MNRNVETCSQAAGPTFVADNNKRSILENRLASASLRPFLESRRISGAVTLVACDGRICELDAIGKADLNSGRDMKIDELFWVASMTKPITAACIMMLVDEGKVTVDAPVESYLSEFKNQWLVAEASDERMILQRPARPVTVHDLLTHTSGLADAAHPDPECTLAEWVRATARAPLQFEPGSRWQYGDNGMNTLGRIIEVISGIRYDEFVQQRILSPLGMTSTTFYPTEAQLSRLAKTYGPTPDGNDLEEASIFLLPGDLTSRRRTPIPAGGLFSKATDMFRFNQMILDGGVGNGHRLLSEISVQEMTRLQTGEIETGFTPGMGFGLGFGIVKEPVGVTGSLSKGTFGHDGAYGTSCWVDPAKKLLMILLIQRAKLRNPAYEEGFAIRQAFHCAAENQQAASDTDLSLTIARGDRPETHLV